MDRSSFAEASTFAKASVDRSEDRREKIKTRDQRSDIRNQQGIKGL